MALSAITVGKLRDVTLQTIVDAVNTLLPASAAWTDYSASIVLTNLTLGNGTQVARYRQVGKTVDYYWQFVLGSTSAVGSTPTLTLPVAPASYYGTGLTAPIPGGAHLLHTGVTDRPAIVKISSGSTVSLLWWNGTPAGNIINAASPFAWAAGDIMTAWGTYEAA